ncbi:hypothetical protein QAD02_014058 [Eretmocerus hayati]|uniref:Uncharacterized protein n=1 Tax=Eretmocerus hayati TaxID=131215 RepID=A0ACC2P5G8_9HYME|nr:hypothetical protein QAD02_014058 [Eretmocerus hayati]
MYSKLVDLAEKNSDTAELNWVVQLKLILQDSEHSYLWDLQDPVAIETALANIEDALTKRSWDEDLVRAHSSSYNASYREVTNLQSSPSCEDYILQNLPLAHTRVFASYRLSGKLHLKFSFKKISYKINQTEICYMCNSGAEDTLSDIVNDCPAYKSIRSRYLDDKTLITILSCPTRKILADLYYFVCNMLKTRSFLLNDCYSEP